MDPFIYLLIQNVDIFIYCHLIFCTHLLLIYRQISKSIHWISREQAASKKSEKYVHIPGCQKNGAFHIGIQIKPDYSYTFCWKKVANHIPGSAEKGGTHIRTMSYIVSPPPLPRGSSFLRGWWMGPSCKVNFFFFFFQADVQLHSLPK